MAGYLNRTEKENLMKTAITKVWLEDMLKTAEEKTPSRKQLITALKYCRTYFNKLLAAMLDGKDEEQVAYTIMDSRKYRFVMMGTQEALKKQAENEKSEQFSHIERKYQEQLIDIVLGSCGMCECTGANVKSCRVREILIALDVDPVDSNSECMYRYNITCQN